MIKRYLKIYPSIYFTKHVYGAPQIKEDTKFLKKDYVFNQYENKKIFLNNKLKKGNCVNEIKRIYYFKLWNALTQYNFTLFENIIQQYLNEGHKYDEVIYSIITHSYILNHKKKNENAYLVIEEMKRAYMHPTIIKINERMINSFLELEIIFCEPTKCLWINICRFIWEISIKLNRERKRKLKEKLNLLPPNEVLKLTREDLKKFLRKEYEDTLLNTIDTIYLDIEDTYDHMKEENNEEKNQLLPHSINRNEYNSNFLDTNNVECKMFLYNENENSEKYNNFLLDKDENSNNCNQYFLPKINDENIKYNIIKESSNQNENCEISDKILKNDYYDTLKIEEDETYESFNDDEDFDIQLLKKYFNFK
ncbi:conserved Plasmodium protein, unknown function [Plasmodium gallinaceum]|uniref:Uncharacterized protein n=1 Tax=Plasmodium gallinaceum TaxID=5849 RepID=A0A1J1GQ98_PLAGA|nr:conserved Plasmodium protein, unknown function [Plasmodium gallinaceum]CRG93471.1 conserved Plasmodium protein, unknown function [Plasmodium gallinaceum]